MPLFTKYTLIFLLTFLSFTTHALEVIRVNIEQNSTSQTIDIQLFDNLVLDTVNNFLSYVDDGSYNNLFINRSVKDFVIQAGGYTFNPSLGGFSSTGTDQFDGGLQPVVSKPTITNEFLLSNLRGTLAMAKKQGLPDSASKEWFINLVDNAFLDDSNSGFTVFGKILGNGMSIIDTIASIPVFNLSTQLNYNGDFTQTPLTNFNSSLTVQDITNNNLIFFRNFKHLFKLTDTINFGDAVAGTVVQQNVVISNTNTAPLTIGDIDTSTISAPFSIIVNNCENVTLPAGENCIITVNFSPLSSDYFVSSINVEIPTYDYNFPVTLKTPTAKLFIDPDIIIFGAQPVFDPTNIEPPKQYVVYLNNSGDRDLNLSSIIFSGENTDEFEFIDNCTTMGNAYEPGVVPAGGFCILVIKFKPVDLNIKQALIEIVSNDPENNLMSIAITGGAIDDNDGISRLIEDEAPNNGDNNNDGLPDGLQGHVVSFPVTNNIYTTIISDSAFVFSDVKSVPLSTLAPIPADVVLDNEAFAFELTGFPSGSIVEFGLILPAGHTPTNIYAFGSTADNNMPHWYTLEKNSTTGVVIFGDVSYGTPGISRNITSVKILDGGDGDADQLADGKIVFIGGPEINNRDSSTSGSLLWLLFLVPITVVVYRRLSNSDS